MIYLLLFFEFFKTGLFSIGGGLATIPFLYDMADKTGWFTYAQIADMIAISESTPGPLGAKMAVFAGFQTAGVPGGIAAVIGLILPSVIIILTIAKFLKEFRENRYVCDTLYGLRPASTALIAAACASVIKISLFDIDLFNKTGKLSDLFIFFSIALAVAVFLLTNKFKKIHPIVFIAVSGVAGIIAGEAGLI